MLINKNKTFRMIPYDANFLKKIETHKSTLYVFINKDCTSINKDCTSINTHMGLKNTILSFIFTSKKKGK